MTDRQPLVTTWDAVPSEAVRPGVSRKGFGTGDVICVMNEIQPEMVPVPHVHEGFDQLAFIVSGQAIYHVGDLGHEVGPGAVMLIPAGIWHWIEPNGDQPIQNLDVFAPLREDYRHLLSWMDSAGLRASGSS